MGALWWDRTAPISLGQVYGSWVAPSSPAAATTAGALHAMPDWPNTRWRGRRSGTAQPRPGARIWACCLRGGRMAAAGRAADERRTPRRPSHAPTPVIDGIVWHRRGRAAPHASCPGAVRTIVAVESC